MNRCSPERCRLRRDRRPRSSRRDGGFVQHDLDLASQEIEQDRDALPIGHAFEQTKGVGKHAVDDANAFARGEPRSPFELDEAAAAIVGPDKVLAPKLLGVRPRPVRKATR